MTHAFVKEGPALAVLVKYFTIDNLGIASLVSRSWQAAVRQCVRGALVDDAAWKQLSAASDQQQDFELPQEHLTTPCLQLASLLIGTGGMSRVYQFAAVPELCVKVCVGGGSVRTCNCRNPFEHHMSAACRKQDGQRRQLDGDLLEAMYNWASGTTNLVGRVSAEECNHLMRSEYEILRKMPRLISCIFPRVLCCGTSGGLLFYLMERLPGITLKAYLQQTLPVSTPNGGSRADLEESLSQMNLLPMFISLLRELRKLHEASRGKFWHGDVKPANILISATQIRLIDPVARPSSHGCGKPQTFMTVRYNPKAYVRSFADTFGLALCMLEVLCDEQPFSGFVRLTNEKSFAVTDEGGDEIKGSAGHVLQQSLLRFKAKWAGRPLVDWLLSWLETDIGNFEHVLRAPRLELAARNYDAMLQQLEVFEAEGSALTRAWKDGVAW